MSYDAIHAGMLRLVDEEHADRLEAISNRWAAYDGELPLPLPVRDGEPDDNVRLNAHRLQVDKGVAFLFGQTITLGLGDDESDMDKQEDALRDFWRTSGGQSWFRKLAKNGAVAGHTFAKLTLDNGKPRAIVLDPSNCEPTWDDNDIDKLTRFRIQWNAYDPERERVVVYRQTYSPEGNGWLILDEISVESGDRWEEIDRQMWAFEWIPIFHAQNRDRPNEFWGSPDLTDDLLALVASIEKVVSDIKRVVRLYGHPKPWVTGGTFGDVDASIDAALEVANADAEIGQLQLGTELEGPINFYRELKSAWHELSHIPEIATGKVDDIGNLSGLALKILYGPLIEVSEEKRDTYGDLICDLSSRALEMMGHGSELLPTINWPDMVPGDPLVEVQVLDAGQAMGVVSKRTIAERLGFDYEQEVRRLGEEGEQAETEKEPLEELPEPAR